MKKATLSFLLFLVLICPSFAVTYTVTNCSSSVLAPGSLPWAINNANTEFGTVEVAFNIPSSEAGFTTEAQASFWRIALTEPLILLHNGIYINGSSQTSNEGNTNPYGPEIELTKGTTTSLEAIIKIQSVNYCTVEGLAINNSLNYGIMINFSNYNRVKNCFIGASITGETSKPNILDGIYVQGGNYNIIGGAASLESNIISGNGRHGIHLNSSNSNQIIGNRVGTGTSDSTALGNANYGIFFENETYSQTVESNIIANNGNVNFPGGIFLDGTLTRYNKIARNRFFSNYGDGIKLSNASNQNVQPPVILTSEAYSQSNRTFISGTSNANSYIDVFRVETPEADSAGEGKYLVASTEADSLGQWSAYAPSNLGGLRITAAQTDTSLNTSQFAGNAGPQSLTVEYRPDLEIGLVSSGSDYIGSNVINTSGFMQTKSKSDIAGRKATFFIRATNTGSTGESFLFTGTSGDPSWEVNYYNATSEGTNITSQATRDGYSTAVLGTSKSTLLRMEISAKVTQNITKNIFISAASKNSAFKKDVVLATTVATIGPQALENFTFIAPASADAKLPFIATFEARKADGTITTEVNNITLLSVDLGTITPESIDASQFTDDGIWAGEIILSKGGTRTIRAACGSKASSFTILTYNGTSEFSDSSLGVTVSVPNGAASDEVTITISELATLPGDPPASMWQAGRIISLTSNVAVFVKPLTITFPLYSGVKSPKVYYWTGSQWSQSGITQKSTTDTSITFDSTHLTVFTPFSPAQAAQYIFGPSPYSPEKDGAAYFWYWLNSQKNTALYIFDLAGNAVCKKEFASGSNGALGGMNSVSWDGRSNYGRYLENGTYMYQIIQENRAISRGKFIILK
ncbi:right-handed parallel beta-helix repeat-containing protein [Candidatus Saganbacteria bacterium]|nr:right-handed parallel beta-helix repeat-containing protein [Candidatus Saganbacteria bacterium]